MIWLAFRQFRMQAAIAACATVAVVVLLVATRHGIVRDPANLSVFQQTIRLVGTGLIGAPALIGAFWGAPLVAREFEAGTHLLAWTQSVTRTRWLATKLAVIAIASIAATAIISLTLTWWSAPIDRLGNRIGTANFGQRGIAPVGYALFGLALGTLVGAILRRTLPAMATALTTFFVVRFVVQLAVRPHLLSPVSSAVPTRLFNPTTEASAATGAWILSSRTVDAGGRTVDSIDNLLAGACSLTRASTEAEFGACASRLGFRDVVTMQPANRFWTLQMYETAIFVGIAAALVAATIWYIGRRNA